MAFTRQNPFTKKTTDLPDKPSPTYTATDIKTYIQTPSDENKSFVDGLITELESTTDGASGLDNIGMTPIAGITGTPQTALVYLKSRVDATKPTLNIVSVLDYGAKGDNSTDDTTAINNAITYCNGIKSTNYRPTLYFPSNTGYKTTSTITIPSGINVIMDGPIISYVDNLSAGLVIGGNGQYVAKSILRLKVIKNTLSDWVSEDSIGIKIFNASNSDITIDEVRYFTIGVQFIGSGTGFAYNTINLNYIYANKIQVDLTNELSGYCNENIFIGGRLSTFSGVNTNKSRYGVRITSKDGTYTSNNNNVFHKPSFELSATDAGTGEAIPILIEYGIQNYFLEIRDEGNTRIARIMNSSQANYISAGYGSDTTIDDQSTYPVNFYDNLKNKRFQRPLRNLVSLNNIVENTKFYDDSYADYNFIKGMVVKRVSNTTNYKAYPGVVKNTDYIALTTIVVGVFIDTTDVEEFIVGGKRKTGYGGRFFVVTYDSTGTQITTDNGQVKGFSNQIPVFSSNLGGCFQTGSDSNSNFYFKVDDTVSKVFIGIGGGTSEARVQSFTIDTLNQSKSTIVDISPSTDLYNVALKAPTVGTYKKGDTLTNDNPTELGTAGSKYVITGWKCIADGTPGTWIEMRSLTGN